MPVTSTSSVTGPVGRFGPAGHCDELGNSLDRYLRPWFIPNGSNGYTGSNRWDGAISPVEMHNLPAEINLRLPARPAETVKKENENARGRK